MTYFYIRLCRLHFWNFRYFVPTQFVYTVYELFTELSKFPNLYVFTSDKHDYPIIFTRFNLYALTTLAQTWPGYGEFFRPQTNDSFRGRSLLGYCRFFKFFFTTPREKTYIRVLRIIFLWIYVFDSEKRTVVQLWPMLSFYCVVLKIFQFS